MSTKQQRIDEVIKGHNEAASKLDYFILGVTLAVCAYLAQTNPYGRIGLNKQTFLLFSLLVFAASAGFGFKRIESAIKTARLNAFALDQTDPQATHYYLSKLRDDTTGSIYYTWRNRLLYVGLFCYVATNVWATY